MFYGVFLKLTRAYLSYHCLSCHSGVSTLKFTVRIFLFYVTILDGRSSQVLELSTCVSEIIITDICVFISMFVHREIDLFLLNANCDAEF